MPNLRTCQICSARFMGHNQRFCKQCAEKRERERAALKLLAKREERAARGARSYAKGGAPQFFCECGGKKDHRALKCIKCVRAEAEAIRLEREALVAPEPQEKLPKDPFCKWCGNYFQIERGLKRKRVPDYCSEKCSEDARHSANAEREANNISEAGKSSNWQEMQGALKRCRREKNTMGEATTLMEIIAFPDPELYLALIAEISEKKHIDKRTREFRQSIPAAGALGRARQVGKQ